MTTPDPEAIPTFYWKRNDTSPPIQHVISYETDPGVWVGFDGTGATVKFIMRAPGGGEPVIDADADWISEPDGAAEYWPLAADTAVSGSYNGEFQTIDVEGKKRTWPNPGYIPIVITDDLDDA